jgi:hypothetical protein
VVVVLKVTNSSTRREIGFKAKGDGRNYDGLNFETAFGNNYQYVDVGDAALMFSPTDSAGVVQWSVEGGGTAEVELIGYLDFSYDGSTAVGHSLTANTWTDFDFSSAITEDVLAFFVVSSGGGSADNYFAKYKTDPLTNWNATAGSCNYGASEGKLSWDADSMFTIPVKSDGLIQLLSNATGVTHTVTLIGYAPMTVNPTIIFDDVAPTSFTDQSAGVGSRSAFVFLATNQYEGSLGVNYGAHFRPNGDTDTWVEGNSRGTTVYSDCTRTSDTTHDCKQTIPVGNDGIFEWQLGNPPGGFKTRLYTYGAILGPASPLAHWPLNDRRGKPATPHTVLDVAAGGSGAHDGQVTTWSSAEMQPGGVGGAHLGRMNQYGGWVQNISNPSDLRLNGEVSVLAWGSPDQYAGWNNTNLLASCDGARTGATTENSPWVFDVTGRKLRFYWYTSSAWVVVQTAVGVMYRQGMQHFGAVRYEITPGSPSTYGVRFYVDGQLVSDADNGGAGYAGPVGGENSVPYLGRRQDLVTTYQSDTSLDSVRFYDSALSGDDVLAVYEEEVQETRYTGLNEDTFAGPLARVTGVGADVGDVEVGDTSEEAGVGGDEYGSVDVGDNEVGRTDDGANDYENIDAGPLRDLEGTGWNVP